MSKRLRRVQQHRDRLLDHILDAPDLARVVPQLQPEVLHRLIQHSGLEECAELVALATPGQLARVFDLDLWRPAAPGLDEQFDADRFGLWLEVMVEAGVSRAATLIAAMDVSLIAAGLAQQVRVFDYAAVAPYITLDGEEASPALAQDDNPRCEVGGYVVSAKSMEFWDAITSVLIALAEEQGHYFHRVMRACCDVSNSRPEVDGLDDLLTTPEQAMFDLAVDREARREAQGYVTPAQARAFLQSARRMDIRQRTRILRGAEPIPSEPGALAEARHGRASRLARIRAHLEFAHDRNPNAYTKRSAELAYLANVIVAGSTIQSRPVGRKEASHAAVAICNLGLENWPAPLFDEVLIRHDLVDVFQIGWTVLYEDVCMYAAEQLIEIVGRPFTGRHSADEYVEDALESLRVTLTKHWRAGSPWEARDALEVIAVLDTPSWAALLGLIDQHPTLHAAVNASLSGTTHQIDASAFEFISQNTQIEQIREFMRRLPDLLR